MAWSGPEKRRAYERKMYATPQGRRARLARSKKYNATPKGKAVSAINSRRRAYGLTDLQFQAMLVIQCGKCAICGRPLDGESLVTVPHVDHNHETKVVRGLLCGLCNQALIGLEKSLEWQVAARAYLGEG